jgi:hypothetical protein
VVLSLVFIAAFADLLAPHSPIAGGDLRTARLLPPSAAHLFGTDEPSPRHLQPHLHGARLTLVVVALVTVIIHADRPADRHHAGYFGGWVDIVLMRVTDIFLAFPRLILALAFVAALGPGIENAIIAIAITSWPPYARIARAETLTIRGRLHRRGPLRAHPRRASSGPRGAHVPALGDRAGDPRHGRHHPDRRRARLPRPRRPAAPARMGRDDRRRPALPDRPLVGPRPCPASPSSSSRSASTCWATACATCSTRRREMTAPLLDVQDLSVTFPTRTGLVEAVRGG